MEQEQEQARTEEATAYKLEEARKKGMVARSLEVSTLAVMAALAGYLWIFGADTVRVAEALIARAIVQAPSLSYGPQELWTWSTLVAARIAYLVLPLMLLVLAIAVLAILLQIGCILSVHALRPDFSRLNPANGLKRIFSHQTLYETGKSILKLIVYSVLAGLVVAAAALHATDSAVEPRAVAALIGAHALKLLFWLIGAMALFAAIDLLFVRRQYAKKMMMSRRELREEMRQREGDGRIKQRRRQLAQELLKRSRSMRQLRSADVLVTNPTHYAVAMRYDSHSMLAPQVVSKGAGEFALRLRRLAFVYGVPVVEDKALARALFFKVALDSLIPEKFFRRTAAIYMRLQTQKAARQRAAGRTLLVA